MKRWWGALALVGLVTAARADAFCGFYVSGGDAKLYNNATQVVLMREGTRTVLSMANNYEGPPENFAMVVPVPVILQKENVKTLPKALFDKIDQLDAPRLVEYWEQDPCPKPVRFEESDKNAVPAPVAMAPSPARPASARDLGVRIEAQFTVGEYEIVILSAKDASGLDTWLKQEKYKIPDGSTPYFRPYVAAGSKFFVARVDQSKVTRDAKGNAMLSPLRFHYDSEQFSLPVRLGLVNSKGTQDLIVHILAKNQRYEVANYPNVTIPTNLDVSEKARNEFGSFYAALYDSTLAKSPKAVVTEYSWSAATCDPCPGPVLTDSDIVTLGYDAIVPPPEPGSDDDSDVDSGDCTTPFYFDAQGMKHYKPQCLGGAPPAPPKPVAVPKRPAPRPARVPSYMPMSNGGFTLTRLHARYTKEALGEDLVFKAAPPIVGGREVMAPSNDPAAPSQLEHGARPDSTNNFQGRYAIRHPWTGPIECKNPRRGVWGGPPAGVTTEPGAGGTKPAKDLAFVPRDVPLPAYLRSEVPELGMKPAGTSVSGVGPSGATPPPEAPAPKRSACGCDVGPAGTSGAFAALAGLAALVVRRRRRS